MSKPAPARRTSDKPTSPAIIRDAPLRMVPLAFSSVQDTLTNAQREFYALELGRDSSTPFAPARFDLSAAEEDGTLAGAGSTYSPENFTYRPWASMA